MTTIQRMNSDIATTERRQTEDKTVKDGRSRNDELTQERRSKADKATEEHRIRNDEITADRREVKDGSPYIALAVSLLIMAALAVVIVGFI